MIRRLIKGLLDRLGLLGSARRLLGRTSEHGHTLLIRLLDAQQPRMGHVLEVGTTRERLDGQGSTLPLARATHALGLAFVTVDMDPANTELALADLAPFPTATAVTAKGEDFISSFGRPVAAAYLDAFDIDHGQHSTYRHDRYRKWLGTTITNEGAAQMHEACVRGLIPLVQPGGLIVIDDTWRSGRTFQGKGAKAVPLLLTAGFRIVATTRRAVALQRDSAE